MEPLRISGKHLGELALPGFCARAFWIGLRVKELPFQIFPGIFSSIDSYSKKITKFHYAQHQTLMTWLIAHGLDGAPVAVPHHTKFRVSDLENNILLTGAPDEILRLPDGAYAILDYKTAHFTNAQDNLLPLYQIQLNAYAYIAERAGFAPVRRIALLYYEPLTDINATGIDALIQANGFAMHFGGNLKKIEINLNLIPPLLARVRQIVDLPTPPASDGCANCRALDALVELLNSK
ncbi:MAG: PD-(D/E)XK nuclease family protein [Chloroflexi bacterium]|nr:PD-(D/E)XK nuclease family protein [Chloroflexota bacterium]